MDNMRKIAETMGKDGDSAIEQTRDIADNALEKGRDTWKNLSAQGKQAVADAQKRTEEAWEDAQELVQRHPGKSVGIALLVGAAIGALLAFRKND